MVRVVHEPKFKVLFSKIKNSLLKDKIIKQIQKIRANPEIGKPMSHDRKGTRELYVKPFRLSYVYDANKKLVYILDLYRKKKQ